MNYLITGGTGLIGKALIEKLLIQNDTITVLTRNIKNAETVLGNNVNFITHLSINEIENSDIIINLAGEPIADKRWSASQKNKICESRWGITQQLSELINKANNPPTLFISGSAIGIYGRQNSDPIDEHFTAFNKEFTHEVCSKWEKSAYSVHSNKTRVALLRTGIVLANNDGALGKMLLPFKLGLGGKISKGEQIMSWIHINDVVNAILHIKERNELYGAINLTAPNPVSNTEFSTTLSAQLQRPCLFTTPAWLLVLIFGEMSGLLLFGQHVLPNKLINSNFTFQYNHIDKALQNLT